MEIIQQIEATSRDQLLQMKNAMSGDSEVRRFFDDAVVFITGGSGFLGKQLIEKLLRSCNIRKIYLLLRSKREKNIMQRLKDILDDPAYEAVRKDQPGFETKIIPIEGDVGSISLGIHENDWLKISEEVNVIFHAAATINFEEPLKMATLTNIRGTREVVRLARDCKFLKSLVHVSTAYANATKSRVKTEVKEDFYKSPIPPEALIQLAETMDEEMLKTMIMPLIAEWPNTYTFTKSVTEDFLSNITDIPLCIVRPAIVIASYREPSPGWVDVKHAYGPSGIILGVILGISHTILADENIDVHFIPVDIVNNAAIAAAAATFKRYSAGDRQIKIYNAACHRNPMKFGDLVSVMNTETRSILPPWALWYCFAVVTKFKLLYILLTCFLHYIPGYFIDGCCMLIGKKPRLINIYKKIYNLSSVFKFFSSNDWMFEDSHTKNLYEDLTASDKIIFNFDVPTINVRESFFIWSYGVRKYIIKDQMRNIEFGVKKQFWLKIVHYILMPFYIYFIFKIISTGCIMFYYSLSTISLHF